MLFVALSALALATSAAAQNQVMVQVGATATAEGGVFQYIPSSVTAPNGTVVTFQFSGVPGNHSVTQSSFANPCQPLAGGFDSGWVSEPSKPETVPEFNLTITDDSKPIWFFCKQLLPSPHCQAGMAGGINVPTSGTNTIQNFIIAAKNSTGMPGQGVGNLVGVGASASAPVGPSESGVSVFGAPTPGAASASAATSASGASATGSSGTGSGSAAAPTSTSAASHVAASSIVVLFAAALGFAMV